MALQVPIGIEDFRKLRERGLEYVDKSRLICELIDLSGVEAVLLPRPRRFGKSLNLSMLRCFFEKRDEDLSHLFADLAVWRAGDAYRAHFQRYPVIYLNFKDVKPERAEEFWDDVRERVRDAFNAHRAVLDGGQLDEVEAARFRQILDGTAPPALYRRALEDLSGYLRRHHGERVVILIDEYDAPIHAGYLHGYAREALGFFRVFLGGGLKGNPEGVGLLAVLEPAYRVRSNRESGQGRPDVMISPTRPGQPGVLLELEVARAGEKTLEAALAEGLAQLAGRGYEAELRAAGADPIHAFAVAFDGKDVRVRAPA